MIKVFLYQCRPGFWYAEEGDLSGWATKAKWQKSSECGGPCSRRRGRRRRRRRRRRMRRYRELVARSAAGISWPNPTVAFQRLCFLTICPRNICEKQRRITEKNILCLGWIWTIFIVWSFSAAVRVHCVSSLRMAYEINHDSLTIALDTPQRHVTKEICQKWVPDIKI